MLGLAIVTHRSADVIEDCLASLVGARGVCLRIVVLDNASDDDTRARIRAFARARASHLTFAEASVGGLAEARADLTLLRAPVNGGFAYGVNRCLEILMKDRAIDLFWLLNPDARALAQTPLAFARAGADGAFALMGGRVVFAEQPGVIQADGGRVSRWTGRCVSVNRGRPAAGTASPRAAGLDYISGASCVASRRFIESAGLMPEDYFLFYEEVDWAQRRGRLELRVVPGAVVVHQGGSSIGSATLSRAPSSLACYFSARNRMRYLRRFPRSARLPARVLALMLGAAYGLALAARLWLGQKGGGGASCAVLAGTLGLPAPRSVRRRIDPAAHARAFGRFFRS